MRACDAAPEACISNVWISSPLVTNKISNVCSSHWVVQWYSAPVCMCAICSGPVATSERDAKAYVLQPSAPYCSHLCMWEGCWHTRSAAGVLTTVPPTQSHNGIPKRYHQHTIAVVWFQVLARCSP